ncbi:hypothetical protein NE237_024862 [Protea cynaroides]|uniref:NB-ARC domain-containing protein n=1 Tax=Protea cynaroides TaxID=273540 RepID=A0A9Q0JZL4_9MAGN|nr:hypothetical protein NE237_024862 [Protea cynaroides]
MVTMSATLNKQDIQTRISEHLILDLSNTSEDGAREKLSNALSNKKFLLILDDMDCGATIRAQECWNPHPTRSHKVSNIMLTTRHQDMDADFIMNVQPLLEDEAWSLFVEKAGLHVTADPINPFAAKIVKRCEGLPLAIVTVARAMANTHGVGEWANAEREMKESIQDIRGTCTLDYFPRV